MSGWHAHPNLEGVVQRHFEGDPGVLVRQKVQDIEPIVERNKAIRNHSNGRTQGGGRFVGSIPATVHYEWVKEWTARGLIGPGNMERLNSLLVERLRDSDFSKFRTTDGGI